MQRALEVLLLFASQKALINVSLTAIGILWHVTDTLGRSRPAVAEPIMAASGQLLGDDVAGGTVGTPRSRGVTPSSSFAAGGGGGGGAAAAGAGASGLGLGVPGLAGGGGATGGGGDGPGGGGVVDHSCRHDMTDAEVTAQLLRVFTHLRQLSTDARPEVRG